MKKRGIPSHLRQRVAREARCRCGYCLCIEEIVGMPMEVEHIIPEAAGGTSVEENLWLACRRCNQFKGTQTHGKDPLTGRKVRLFHPRNQSWKRHFQWDVEGTEIIGKTACGRATVLALQMNTLIIVGARRKWVEVGWWPPEDS